MMNPISTSLPSSSPLTSNIKYYTLLFLVFSLLVYFLLESNNESFIDITSVNSVIAKNEIEATLSSSTSSSTSSSSLSSSNKENNPVNQLNNSNITQLKLKHPECFKEDLFTTTTTSSNKKKEIKRITEIGKWMKIGRNVTRSTRYSYLCPFIKPRYNCAKNETSMRDVKYGDIATDWKLVLRSLTKQERLNTPGKLAILATGEEVEEIVPDNNTQKGNSDNDNDDNKYCNLWEFVSDLGGPVGLAEHLLKSNNDNYKNNNNDESRKQKANRKMITIVLNGNSYLRQLFEALVCGFYDNVSNVLLQKNKEYCISQAAIKLRNGTKITFDEIGTLERPPDIDTPGTSSSCHPATHNSKYYEQNVSLPLQCTYDNNNNNNNNNKDGYDDNIAMVEFGGIIRFYYIFNPIFYDNLGEIFEKKLQLDPYDVDMLLFNNGGDKAYNKDMNRNNGTSDESLFGVFNRADGGPWQSRIKEWPYTDFQITQRKQQDIMNNNIMKQSSQQDYWFGATNPFITNKPDSHACMPGVPDDEVNFLLFTAFFSTLSKIE